MSNNVVKMRAKKAALTDNSEKIVENLPLILGIAAAVAILIYLYRKRGGPTTDGGTSLPSDAAPARTSMDMAVIPGARTN